MGIMVIKESPNGAMQGYYPAGDAPQGAAQVWSTVVSDDDDHNVAGKFSFLGKRITEVSATGDVDIYIERVFGAAGAISCNYTTFASLNTTAGVNYTETSGTLNFDTRTFGVVKITVPILAIPSGFGLIGIELTSGSDVIHHARAWIWLQGSGLVSGAKFVSGNGTTDTSADSSGSGTEVDPWKCPTRAVNNMTNSGGVLYMRGGTYRDLSRISGQSTGGFSINNKSCAKTSPLVIMPYPGETVVIDQGYNNSADGTGNACAGIFVNNSSHIWTVAIKCQNTKKSLFMSHDSSATPANDWVILGCEGTAVKDSGSNLAGVRFDHTLNLIVQDSYFHHLYSTQGGVSSNPFDAEAAGLTHGAECYRSRRAAFVHCEFDVCLNGVYSKQGNDELDHAVDVSHCLFTRCQTSAIKYGIQGTGTAQTVDALARYNVLKSYAASGAQQCQNFIQGTELLSAGGQNARFYIYRNTAIDCQNFFRFEKTNELYVYDNIYDGLTAYKYRVGLESGTTMQLTFSDNNDFYGGSQIALTDANGSSTSYTTLAGWRAAYPSDPQVLRDVDENSIEVEPLYANEANDDYRILSGSLATAGRLQGFIGVGDQQVGRLYSWT